MRLAAGAPALGAMLPLALALLALSAPAAGQELPARRGATAFAGGVPVGEPTSGALDLTLEDAIDRALGRNLAPLLAAEDVRRARAGRVADQGGLLPRLTFGVQESRLQTNLEAFGFHFPGAPALIGPYDLVDARLRLDWALFDPAALARSRRGEASVDAAELGFQDLRELVALEVADRYLRALAAAQLEQSVEAEVRTSETLRQIAVDRKQAGAAAGIEVLRAEVRLAQDRQRLIVARNGHTKLLLELARMIGLPLGQEIALVDRMTEDAPAPSELDPLVAAAWQRRRDLAAATARVEAARQARRAATRDRLPSLQLRADYGALGPDPGSARETFDLAAMLAVPLYDRSGIDAEALRAEAELRARQAELEDRRAAIYYEVRVGLLDLTAAREQLQVARAGRELARAQLEQAQNRFAAGVASNLEVVEAQESLARADESYIASLYRHTLDRLRLARAAAGTFEALPGLLRRGEE